MNIAYASDLHLEFGEIEAERFDVCAGVLVLAGDIMTVKNRNRYIDFFQMVGHKFDKVFYVLGNHEHYGETFQKTADRAREILPDNVILLDDEDYIYEGVKFIGGTLWTDFNDNDYFAKQKAKDKMNDFHVIKWREADGNYKKFHPMNAMEAHLRTKRYIDAALLEGNEKKVVITHHLPTFDAVAERFRPMKDLNGAYATNLDEFIFHHEPAAWFFGHTHDAYDGNIGRTRVVCNPRGYVHYENVDDFVVKVLEV